jgi:hypothetical protein
LCGYGPRDVIVWNGRASFMRRIAAYLQAQAGGEVYVYDGRAEYDPDEPTPSQIWRATLGTTLMQFATVRENSQPIRVEREEREHNPIFHALGGPFTSARSERTRVGRSARGAARRR